MYFYQHPSGRTIKVNSLEELLNIDDQELWASPSKGREIMNPFFDTHSDNEEELEEDVLFIDLPDIDDVNELDIIDEDFE